MKTAIPTSNFQTFLSKQSPDQKLSRAEAGNINGPGFSIFIVLPCIPGCEPDCIC